MIRKIASSAPAFILLLGCWQLAGCAQWRYEMGAPLAQLQTSASQASLSRSEVLDRLGPPLHLSAIPGGYAMSWEHWKIDEDSVGLSLGLLGADFLNLDWGIMRTQGEYLLLTFNMQHRVTSASRSDWDGDAGSGYGVQPLVSVLSMVDSDDLRDGMPQHRWGSNFLQRLPSGLNRQSSPYTGQNGLEQRGTPRDVGQQSLQMD